MSLADSKLDVDTAAFAESDGGSVADYIALLKPRVMSLVIFTALTGIMVAPGGLHPVVALSALLCIAVGAGASGALNMWYDADIDALMRRTAKRPVPSGRITPQEALTFGLTLSGFSVMLLGVLVNWFAAGLLAFTIFFYAIVYTMWLKRATPHNIVIGGAAGAFPPMIGWAAVTGSISLESVVLFLIIFMWTPPHFWALSLFAAKDYAKAGVPMLPVVAGERETRRQIFYYSLVLAPLGVVPSLMGFAGIGYGVIAVLLGAAFLYHAWKVLSPRDETESQRGPKALFGYSILYLFALFAALLIEQGLGLSIEAYL